MIGGIGIAHVVGFIEDHQVEQLIISFIGQIASQLPPRGLVRLHIVIPFRWRPQRRK